MIQPDRESLARPTGRTIAAGRTKAPRSILLKTAQQPLHFTAFTPSIKNTAS